MRNNDILKVILVIILFLALKTQAHDINCMAFNIWHAGASVSNGLIKIRDVIVSASPDIVCFSEVLNSNSEDCTINIINELSAVGQTYHRGYAGGDVSLISTFPILESSLIYNQGGTVASFDVDVDDDTIIVACAHLDYMYYQNQ